MSSSPITGEAAPDVVDPSETTTTDRAAVTLSILCIIHCLALPVAAIALPFLSVVAEAEWVHWVFAILAVLASGLVVLTSPGAREFRFLFPAIGGAALIIFGLFAEGFGFDETAPTVIGGALLAFAHGRRLLVR